MTFGRMGFFANAAGLLVLSSSAFAMHAYRSMDCRSETHALIYKGSEAVGGDFGISKLSDDANQDESLGFLALPSDHGSAYGQDELGNADVLFSEKSSAVLGKSEKSQDCGFDHEEWKSLKVIRLDKVSPDVEKKLELKTGDEMTLTCEETTDSPNGKDCD